MTRKQQVLSICTAVSTLQFVFAFIAAPHSCEWGLAAYFWLGLASLLTLFVTPILLRTDCSVSMRAAYSLGFVVLGIAVWMVGLIAANVRILCRLF